MDALIYHQTTERNNNSECRKSFEQQIIGGFCSSAAVRCVLGWWSGEGKRSGVQWQLRKEPINCGTIVNHRHSAHNSPQFRFGEFFVQGWHNHRR
jgi:hypothetical protein